METAIIAEFLLAEPAPKPFDRDVIAVAANPDIVLFGSEFFFLDLTGGEMLVFVFIKHARHPCAINGASSRPAPVGGAVAPIGKPTDGCQQQDDEAAEPCLDICPPAGHDVCVVLVRPDTADFADGLIDAVDDACGVIVEAEFGDHNPVDDTFQRSILGGAIAAADLYAHIAIKS